MIWDEKDVKELLYWWWVHASFSCCDMNIWGIYVLNLSTFIIKPTICVSVCLCLHLFVPFWHNKKLHASHNDLCTVGVAGGLPELHFPDLHVANDR